MAETGDKKWEKGNESLIVGNGRSKPVRYNNRGGKKKGTPFSVMTKSRDG